MDESREAVAAAVLRREWGVEVRLGLPHRGIGRLTWRAGAGGWLARESARRQEETLAEVRLLADLASTVEFAVPVPIPTLRGALVARDGDFVWTLCRHVAGERLADEPESYGRLVALLAAVHRDLRGIEPGRAVLTKSFLSLARGVLRAEAGVLPPAAHAGAAWLRGRIGLLEGLPAQVIHGDFGIPNVLVGAGDDARFGVLDWELSACDSPLFDLAQVAFGMVAFSRTAPPRDCLDLLVRQYAAAGGESFAGAQLRAALVAGRLAQIAWLQGRAARGETALVESIRFLDERLARTLRWLDVQP